MQAIVASQMVDLDRALDQWLSSNESTLTVSLHSTKAEEQHAYKFNQAKNLGLYSISDNSAVVQEVVFPLCRIPKP